MEQVRALSQGVIESVLRLNDPYGFFYCVVESMVSLGTPTADCRPSEPLKPEINGG